jgi:hypothetical protein
MSACNPPRQKLRWGINALIDLSVLAVFQVTATHSAVAPPQERQQGARHSHSHAATTLVAVRWRQLAIAVGLASFSCSPCILPHRPCSSMQQQEGVKQRLAA